MPGQQVTPLAVAELKGTCGGVHKVDYHQHEAVRPLRPPDLRRGLRRASDLADEDTTSTGF